MDQRKKSRRSFLLLTLTAALLFVTSCAPQGVTSALQEDVSAQRESASEAPSGSERETFYVAISMEGGSGKAHIESPVEVTKEDGSLTAKFVWSSENYDYMIVDGVRYENENTGGPSTFTVALRDIEDPLTVIGDTTAMSTPHEIEYVITWGAVTEDVGDHAEDDDGEELTAEMTPGGMTDPAAVEKALRDAGLSRTGVTDLKYAKGFSVTYYGDLACLSIENSGDYLLIPEGGSIPEGLPEHVVILQKPLDHTYLVSTSAMDLVNACGALSKIRLSGTKADDWYIDEAKAAMDAGDILYAGKYRAPDYERILSEGCDLAIENTMIYHEPAVMEKLKELGIPVLVETSSYEDHPLGRLEWIRLYGVLFDREKEADDFYEEQLSIMEPILAAKPDTGKSVAFFHVTGGGLINVRRSGDYITKMIELAGGHYALKNAAKSENALSSMNMQMEDFYVDAAAADIIIYNSTIDGELSSVDELIGKNALFADFKAVKEGQVFCTQKNLFQKTTGAAGFMQDLNACFTGSGGDYTFLKKLN